MNGGLDDKLDQLLRDWAVSHRPDAEHLAALEKRIVGACREHVTAKPRPQADAELPVTTEAVRVAQYPVRRRVSRPSWRQIATISAASVALVFIGVALTWWVSTHQRQRETALVSPGPSSASGSVAEEAVVDEHVAPSDVSEGPTTDGPPSPVGPAAEVIPEPVEAEGPMDGPDHRSPPPVIAADTVDGQPAAEEMPRPAIHEAVYRRDLAELKRLLTDDPSLVRATDPAGSTALHVAAGIGAKEIVDLLLAKGADVNAKTTEGKTPLDMAIEGPPTVEGEPAADRPENSETTELLRKHGAKRGDDVLE
ncbi:MAG: ankyrin repeat domain-containing protein [Planctomycetes bacterium]|nr:ankyrin repeat domain-containing protein [Planctomycetota bacterium]